MFAVEVAGPPDLNRNHTRGHERLMLA